jgi:hypothetical protein
MRYGERKHRGSAAPAILAVLTITVRFPASRRRIKDQG